MDTQHESTHSSQRTLLPNMRQEPSWLARRPRKLGETVLFRPPEGCYSPQSMQGHLAGERGSYRGCLAGGETVAIVFFHGIVKKVLVNYDYLEIAR